MDSITLLLPAGLALIALLTIDVLWTTLWLDGGAGPLTARLSSTLWRAYRRVVGPEHDRALSLGGPIIMTAVTVTWVVLMWAAWWCIFSWDVAALHHTSRGTHPDVVERIYFVGYTLFTLGNGEYAPRSGAWQIATTLCTASGMALITLMISFVIAVISAAVDRRALASSISTLGDDAHAIVELFWRGNHFEGIEVALDGLAGRISELTEEHLAYPMLHVFHSASDNCAAPPRLATLYDALLILEFGVVHDVDRPRWAITATRRSLDAFYGTIAGRWMSPSEDAPPLPSLARLAERGLECVDQATFARRAEACTRTRRHMAGLLRREARHMPGLDATPASTGTR